jgi:hypothetical protein
VELVYHQVFPELQHIMQVAVEVHKHKAALEVQVVMVAEGPAAPPAEQGYPVQQIPVEAVVVVVGLSLLQEPAVAVVPAL